MSEKIMKEWFLDAPWGKLAMVSWGDPGRSPVLLVHGYADSAATFVPLVQLLPDTYNYVAFDLPGHGRSEPTPGPPVSYLHFADSIRLIVERLQWNTFICIAHSMGYLISSCYNTAFPGQMRKLVNLDGSIFIGWHELTDQQGVWFNHCYASCYEKYYPTPEPVTYTYDDAVSFMMKTRAVTTEQAASLASRCLEPTGDGKYKFTWDPKVKKIATVLFSFETLYAVLAANPPTLNIVASEDISIDAFRTFTTRMMTKLETDTKHYYILRVKGGHNVHLTNPESFVENIVEFIDRDCSVNSKL